MSVRALHFVVPGGSVRPGFLDAVRALPGVELELSESWQGMAPAEVADRMRGCEILLASRAPAVPDELAREPGRLKYICYLHGTMRGRIGLPIVRSGIRVTNWGDACGRGLAEGSLTLLLAVFKDLPRRIMAVRSGAGRGIVSRGQSLAGLNVGVYGFGFAGREFVRLLAPFGAHIRVYDPYAAEVPDGCTRVGSLRELFAASQAVVIHAGLTDETAGSVSRVLLAMLPDQGMVINTARGAIVDQAALFDELRAGRLRAGLDVLWPDDLPADHEARQWENLVWTCHEFLGENWPNEKGEEFPGAQQVHLDNIRAFIEGRPMQFVIDEVRYSRMT
ncbi:MAG TPA: NAD(P)-dependent oxidoreductase [Planctomycetota bacterium]|nr:NAD(P)-dependent oxidoreductase [Planctomycetota bacterium]